MMTQVNHYDEVVKNLLKKVDSKERTAELLRIAFSHGSWVNENLTQNKNAALASNERLEFLGDSILGLVIADYLYHQLNDQDEGQLSKLKSYLVSAPVLAGYSRKLNLGSALILGRGEHLTGGRKRDSVLANTLEAVIGAIYLGNGIECSKRFILELWQEDLKNLSGHFQDQDYKTVLQELSQRVFGNLPQYTIVSQEGPDHDKRYIVQVEVNGIIFGNGKGRSRKVAEQQAAAKALEKIKTQKDVGEKE